MRRTIQRPVSSRERSTPVAVPISVPILNAKGQTVSEESAERAATPPPVELAIFEECPVSIVDPMIAKITRANVEDEEQPDLLDQAIAIPAPGSVVNDAKEAARSGILKPFAAAFEAAGVKSAAIIREWAANHPELITPSPKYTHYAHRSGHETWWACPRKYYLEYLHCGTGIRKTPTKLALVVGSSVHVGLGVLLQSHKDNGQVTVQSAIYEAVNAALLYFESSDTWTFLQPGERVEQQTLIAGLLFGFFHYRWPSFSKQFEILTVERDWVEKLSVSDTIDLVTSSRPDAIVRDKNTNEIVVISWKTIDDIADYKRANFHQNLQTFLESYYGRKVLRRYLEDEYMPMVPDGLRGKALMEYLAGESERYKTLPAEVDYTLTIFLVKGSRTAKLLNGDDISLEEAGSYTNQDRVYKQQSPLCYRWQNLGDSTLCGQAWTQRYYKEGNVSYNNIGKDFVSAPVPFEELEQWVISLNNGEVFPSTEVDSRNSGNPLMKVIVDEEPEYWDGIRAEQAMRSFVAESRTNAERAAYLRELAVEGTLTEELLDTAFRKHLTSCNNSAPSAGFPIKCEYKSMCVGSDELVQILPGSDKEGIWSRRQPHHNAEIEGWKEEKI